MASETTPTVLFDYWRSSAAYRLRIALAELGEPYTAHHVDLLTGAHRAPENLARNPQGLVPTLQIDGNEMVQSLAILEYLEETRGAGWLPADPMGRAHVRSLCYAIAMEIHPVCNLSVAKFGAGLSDGKLDMKGWMHAFIPKGLQAFETLLSHGKDGKFCYGDTLTLADFCLVPQVYNARRWEIDLADLPRISAIMTALETLPSVQAAHPDMWAP
jgi:maleylacetoacetate isomerase